MPSFSLKDIPKFGPKTIQKFNQLGVYSAFDLLLHFPRAYQDRTRLTPIRRLEPLSEAMVEGTLLSIKPGPPWKKMLSCEVEDATGVLTVRFFNVYPKWLQQFEPGRRVRLFGQVKLGVGQRQMLHPECVFAYNGKLPALEKTLTPIYASTAGLSQARIRSAIDWVIEHTQAEDLPSLLPKNWCERLGHASFYQSVCALHHPAVGRSQFELSLGQSREQKQLAFEELLAHRLSMHQLRHQSHVHPAKVLKSDGVLQKQLIEQLPFELTGAQQRVIDEVQADLGKTRAMLRLLQGDVGSGKTLVAVMALLQTVDSGQQGALMVPTEILAEQHYLNLCQWLEPLDVKVAYLVSKQPAAQRRETLARLASGDINVVVGTQALFQDAVKYHALALVILDEQHRFGVEQRRALRDKADDSQQQPHQLLMTATPIPRTLAMTAYADLDVSVIDELPKGRKPIQSAVVANEKRASVIERVKAVCHKGAQVYWVCTLIEESELIDSQAAKVALEKLTEQLPSLKLGWVHGRMKADEKAEVMMNFKTGELDVLVATTVIEVGVDVPNASVMVIENAERLGLSQLHQLRGRVGRGSAQSYCLLLYQSPLTETAQERLEIMRSGCDGFEIAQQDMRLRGPGDLLGTRQSGEMSFKCANLARDENLLEQVKAVADDCLRSTSQVEALIERWVGRSVDYATV